MKILMLTDRMDCGGAETHVLELAAGLVRNGHIVCVISSGGGLVSELVTRGVFHIRMPMNKASAAFLVPRICRLVKMGGFDVIHSHARVPSLIASIVAKKMGIRFVSTAHARFSSRGLKRRLSRWGEKSIAVSEDLKQYLIQSYNVPAKSITVIPNGVDSSRFYPRVKDTDGALTVAFLSRLDVECSLGALLLCDIAPQLFFAFGPLEIHIGGGGNALGRVRERAERINSELGFECIKVLGRIDDTPAFLRRADIFVGVSRAAIEASFCGASVIICGDEGFLGALSSENFSLARSTNFCARGLGQASACALYGEIAALLDQSRESRAKNAMAVRELMLDACELERCVESTQEFYRRALSRPFDNGEEVLLCGYYGFGNMGDDALLRGAICRAKQEFCTSGLRAITRNGKKDESRFEIRCIGRNEPYKLYRALRSCRHFVFGGGTLLQDSTSRRSLLYYSCLLKIAKRHGARCYLWGNGIGEPRDAKSEEIIRKTLLDCEYIGLRDERSVILAKRILGGESSSVFLEPDIAEAHRDIFCASEERTQYLLADIPRKTEFVIVALKGKRCPRALERLLRAAVQKGQLLLFVAMYPKQDLKLTARYCKKYSGIIKSGIDFDDLVSVAKFSSGVYSMRLHALVAAKLAGVPFVGFGESKVTEYS